MTMPALSVNQVEGFWIFISAVGLAVALAVLHAAYDGRVKLRLSKLNGTRNLMANMLLQTSLIHVISQGLFLYLGLVSAFVPEVPPNPNSPAAAQFFAVQLVWVLNVVSIISTLDRLSFLYRRGRLNSILLMRRLADRVGLTSSAPSTANELPFIPTDPMFSERIWTALVSIGGDRKFWLTFATVLSTIALNYFGVDPALWQSIDGVLLALIGAFAYEDSNYAKWEPDAARKNLLTLFHSRKFLLGLLALAQMVALNHLGVAPNVWQSISLLIVSYIGVIAHADVKAMEGQRIADGEAISA